MPRRLQRFCQKPLVENGDAVAYSFYLSARQEFPSSRHHNYRWRSDSGYFGVGKIHSFRYIQRHRDRHHRRRCRRLCGLGGRCQLWRNLAEEATRGEIGESGGVPVLSRMRRLSKIWNSHKAVFLHFAAAVENMFK